MDVSVLLREAAALQRCKEDENTWSRINGVLEGLSAAMVTEDDARSTLRGAEELIVRSMASDRSKLSGTALTLLKRSAVLLGVRFEWMPIYFVPLMKVCGKSSRVFYSRGEDTFVSLCKCVNIKLYLKLFNEYSGSANKNVRIAIFKGIEAGLIGNGSIGEFISVIERGKTDQCAEVREICKRIVGASSNISDPTTFADMPRTISNQMGNQQSSLTTFSQKPNTFSTAHHQQSASNIGSKPLITNDRRTRPVGPVRSNFIPNQCVIEQAVAGGRELASRLSPMRKQIKVEGRMCERIKELEKIVKDISGEVLSEEKNKDVEQEKTVSASLNKITEALNVEQEMIGDVKENQDDLTPERLNLYLNKYRRSYGDMLPTVVSWEREGGEIQINEDMDEFSIVDVSISSVEELSKSLANISIVEQEEPLRDISSVDVDGAIETHPHHQDEIGTPTHSIHQSLNANTTPNRQSSASNRRSYRTSSLTPGHHLPESPSTNIRHSTQIFIPKIPINLSQTFTQAAPKVTDSAQLAPERPSPAASCNIRLSSPGCASPTQLSQHPSVLNPKLRPLVAKQPPVTAGRVPAESSVIQESSISVDMPVQRPWSERRNVATIVGNRFSGFLIGSGDEETVFSSRPEKTKTCVDEMDDGKVLLEVDVDGMFQEDEDIAEEVGLNLPPLADEEGSTKKKVTSLFLYESMNSLEMSGSVLEEDDSRDFTAVDSFVGVRRGMFRKGREI